MSLNQAIINQIEKLIESQEKDGIPVMFGWDDIVEMLGMVWVYTENLSAADWKKAMADFLVTYSDRIEPGETQDEFDQILANHQMMEKIKADQHVILDVDDFRILLQYVLLTAHQKRLQTWQRASALAFYERMDKLNPKGAKEHE